MLDSLNRINRNMQRLERWLPATEPDASRQAGASSFRDFVEDVNPRFEFYPHVNNLIDVLQQVADGELDRLMVFMPPRHGKSEVVARLFSAYYLLRYPQRFVGISSYGAELAYGLSRNARDNYERGGGILRDDAYAVKHWETGQGGGLWAAGVAGPITGKGFHLGIIDDPLKNAREAESPTFRQRQKDWYRADLSTREEPGGALVLIMTRWHEDDLAGWLLEREEAEPEHWHIVSMPALARPEEERQTFPASCTVEPDEREAGEALCPERYDESRLARIRRRLGTYFWGALYDQDPTPPEGDMFKREWFQITDKIPGDMLGWMRYWDKAGSTSKSAKFTAGVKIGITADERIIVAHVVRGQWGTLQRREVMKATAEADGKEVPIGIEQEPGSSGLDSVNDEIRLLMGFAAFADRPTGDKDTRLRPFQAQAEAKNVYLVRGAWNQDYIDELCAVPHGTYRDQADATAGAFNWLVEWLSTQAEGVVVHEENVEISPF